MEFIGTEVGIKIRSAIKAKLTELGKTVDDELIDYIMVMVANKKEESQMARDLQPFLESDTVKFTSWLHKVLQKLEQVTVIVTDEEFKIATTAFGKVAKKRKSIDSTHTSVTKKKSSSKDEPKEKKKKLKHEHGKHSKNASGEAVIKPLPTSKDNASALGEKQPKLRPPVTPSGTVSTKAVKLKKSKITETLPDEIGNKKTPDNVVKKNSVSVVSRSNSAKTTGLEVTDDVGTSAHSDKFSELEPDNTATSTTKPASLVRAVIVPVRPVMMVSDDDDDDDDFINIKTDVAEEDELLEDERAQRSAAPPLVLTTSEVKHESSSPPLDLPAPKPPRTVFLEPAIADTSSPQLAVNEATMRQASVVPRSVVGPVSKVVLPSSRRSLKRSPHQQQKPSPPDVVPARKPAGTTPRVSILSRVGAVLKRKASHLSDEEEEESKNGSVASVVKVKPRPKVPAAAQAPKNLLLRAMADAQRSVASAPVREVPKPQPKRSPLFTRKFRDRQQGVDMCERIAITLPNVRDPSGAAAEEEEVEQEEEEEEGADKQGLEEAHEPEAYVPELVTAPLVVPLDVVYSPSPIAKPSAKSSAGACAAPEQQQQQQRAQRCSTPEFLVTLDGYKSYSGFSRTIVCVPSTSEKDEAERSQAAEAEEEEEEEGEGERGEEEEVEGQSGDDETKAVKPRRQKIVFSAKPEDEEEEEEAGDNAEEGVSGSKKLTPRSLDRCRFWPACRLGDECTFHHPTQTCKSFPSCPFGDRCLYIHPNCKFDASCTRKDCPFTHASPRNLSALPAVVVPVPAPRPVMQRLGSLTCRFFPNCSNTNCRFFHPKACRFGRQCSKPDCTFLHSEAIPPKEKMKWVSSMSVR